MGLKLDWDDKIPNDLQALSLKLDWDDKIPNDLQALSVSNWIGIIKYPMIYKLYGSQTGLG